jgi:hypothetical protein
LEWYHIIFFSPKFEENHHEKPWNILNKISMENPRLWPSQGVKDFLDILCGPEKKAPADAGHMSRGHLSPTKWGRTWGRPWDLLMI